jgi:hypothetical protein
LETNTKRFAPAICWGIFIFALCAMPSKNIPNFSWLDIIAPDKWVHAAMHGVLTTLLLMGKDRLPISIFKLSFYKTLITNLKQGGNPSIMPIFGNPIHLLLAIASCLYGVSMEYYQGYFCTDRAFEWSDALADSVGSFVALWFYAKYIFGVKSGNK